ncbi:hypothetical protein [Amycolatopsis plumensis]|uniref:Uncharacterized protein n=1 Tax=Amycolatopsis plumensis TaxID=236508 RepID=A0ABV5U786_9PSEU
MEYATDLFDRSTVEAIAACFARAVGQIVADPVKRIVLECTHQEMYWPDNAAEISRIVNGLSTNLNSGADS